MGTGFLKHEAGLGRLEDFYLCLKPEEIADAVVFLCSPEAKFIHGQLLRVDGGLQLYAG